MAKLVVLTEGFAGRSVELKTERTTIGRLEDNTFQIAEPSVSSHHCEVLVSGTQVQIKDLNSTNGTYIDGNQITEAPLKPGQVLRLGQVELRLDDGTPPPASAKKPLDHTQPVGVKLNDLAAGPRTVNLGVDSPFKKKSNKINLVFIYVGIALGVTVIVLLIRALTTGGGN